MQHSSILFASGVNINWSKRGPRGMSKTDRRKIDALEIWCWRLHLQISWAHTNVSNLKLLIGHHIVRRLYPQRTKANSEVFIACATAVDPQIFGHITRKQDTVVSLKHEMFQGWLIDTRLRGRSPTRCPSCWYHPGCYQFQSRRVLPHYYH